MKVFMSVSVMLAEKPLRRPAAYRTRGLAVRLAVITMNKAWYAAKQDEMYRAYQAAIEMEEMEEAERIFKESERYANMAKD